MAFNYLTLLYGIAGCAVLALLFAGILNRRLDRASSGTEKMQEVGQSIREGAMAFITHEYRILAIFVLCVAAVLAIAQSGTLKLIAISFIVGACCSALAGFIGMRAATKANVRTANAARKNLESALTIAFSGGSIMGMCVVGLGVLGLTVLFAILSSVYGTGPEAMKHIVLPILSGFSC